MAEAKAQTWMITEDDLNELQALKQELQQRVDDAHANGRIYMMAQYVTILAKVSAEVKKVRDRFDRESLAGNRRAHKELKASKPAE